MRQVDWMVVMLGGNLVDLSVERRAELLAVKTASLKVEEKVVTRAVSR